MAFACPLKFERIGLVDDIAQYLAKKRIASDGLDIQEEERAHTLKHQNASIKPVLMDQSTVAGLGNWIVDEVLFQAKIHPEKIASCLSKTEVSQIQQAIQQVLQTAIAQEAVYRNFPASFLIHARQWDTSPYEDSIWHRYCPCCQAEIHISTISGRITYFCVVCQRV